MLLSRCCTRNITRYLCNPRNNSRLLSTSICLRNDTNASSVKTAGFDFATKYADKLQKKANEEGLSVAELKERLKEQERAKRKLASAAKENQPPPSSTPATRNASSTTSSLPSIDLHARKDSSPVKPLSSILNLDKLLETPHTAEQISLLWRAYHTAKSGGTGRGYLCASIPVDTYEKMLSVANRYPSFVIPLPRDQAQGSEAQAESSEQRPCEFYFMEWGLHGSPPEPRSIDALFTKPPPSTSPNPQTTTVLFTPLGEYKLRNSFATPYLVITNYTDLARSHGIVLLRGEITPSTGGSLAAGGRDERYLLSQQDAQLLAMGVQKFYLWDEVQGQGETLLRTFHEDPTKFRWEDLLKHAAYSA